MSINNMKGVMNSDIPKYDFVGNLKKGVDSFVPKNATKDIFDKSPDLQTARDKWIESMMTVPTNVADILVSNAKSVDGKDFTFVNTKSDNVNEIYVKNGMPQITEAQLKAAKDYAKGMYDSMIELPKPVEKKVTSVYEQEQISKINKTKQSEQNLMNDLTSLYSGTADDFNIAASRIMGLDPNKNITSITRTKDGVDVVYNNGKQSNTKSFSFYGTDGKPLSQKQFISKIATNLVSDFTDVNKVPEGILNTDEGGFEVKTKPQQIETIQQLVVPQTNESGKVVYTNALDYFDSRYEAPNWTGMGPHTSVSNSIKEITENILRQIPGDVVGNFTVDVMSPEEAGTKKSATKIFIPNITTEPIYITADTPKEEVKRMIEKIYNATINGETISPEQLSISITSKKVDASKY